MGLLKGLFGAKRLGFQQYFFPRVQSVLGPSPQIGAFTMQRVGMPNYYTRTQTFLAEVPNSHTGMGPQETPFSQNPPEFFYKNVFLRAPRKTPFGGGLSKAFFPGACRKLPQVGGPPTKITALPKNKGFPSGNFGRNINTPRGYL